MAKIISVGNIGGGQTQSRTVYMPQGLSPTLCSSMGDKGNTMPYIVEVNKMCDVVIGSMQKHAFIGNGDYCPSLTEAMGKGGGQIPMIADIKVVGCMDHTIDNTLESANRVYDTRGISPTITTNSGGDHLPKIVVVESMGGIAAIDEQNKRIRTETFGTLTTDGSSPKHNNRVLEVEKVPKVKIRQATAQGFIECEVGGGSRLELSHKSRTQRQSTGQRSDMSDTDNGEYP